MQIPEAFIQYTREMMGDERWRTLSSALEEESPVSIRINPFKCHTAKESLALYDGNVPWCSHGIYLKQRPNFTFDPLLHTGVYYVQEAASMFLDLILRQYATDTTMMLDLCAAPGGKSTVARTALPDGSLLFSNEPMRNRAQILAENIQKFGHPDVIVTNNYASDYKKSGLKFDVILTDVPCSGEGMFRKDEGAVNEWSTSNVENCWKKQREIVSDVWDCLLPGGILIYSTCTFNTKEDEENVRWIAEEFDAEILNIDIDGDWGIQKSLMPSFDQPVYRFIPGITRSEGLFMAVLRKSADDDLHAERQKKGKRTKGKGQQKASMTLPNKTWIEHPDTFDIVQHGTSYAAIPKKWKDCYDAAAQSLKIVHAGIEIGEQKGKDIIPAQSLALSTSLNAEAFPKAALTYTEAISFLRKEPVLLPVDTPKGFVLLTYKGIPLGFEKNIGNRANNLYPAEWKIRSSHIPEDNNEIIK